VREAAMGGAEPYELSAAQEYRLLLLFIRADTSKEGQLDQQVFDELCFFVVNSRCSTGLHKKNWRELSAKERQEYLPSSPSTHVGPTDWVVFFRRLVARNASTQLQFSKKMEEQIVQCENLIEAFPETESDLSEDFKAQLPDGSVQSEPGPEFIALLLVASKEAHAQMIRWVLEHRSPAVDVAHRFADGSTVLHAAASCVDEGNDAEGAVSAVNLLLAAGADPSSKDSAGRTALTIAAMDDVRATLLEASNKAKAASEAASAASAAAAAQQERRQRQEQQAAAAAVAKSIVVEPNVAASGGNSKPPSPPPPAVEAEPAAVAAAPAAVPAAAAAAAPEPEPEPPVAPAPAPSAAADAAAILELEAGGILTMYLASGKKKHGAPSTRACPPRAQGACAWPLHVCSRRDAKAGLALPLTGCALAM
jgi:hypothetical protein